jgi:hypothetical protein
MSKEVETQTIHNVKMPITALLQTSAILICATRLFPSSRILLFSITTPHYSWFTALSNKSLSFDKPSPHPNIITLNIAIRVPHFHVAARFKKYFCENLPDKLVLFVCVNKGKVQRT